MKNKIIFCARHSAFLPEKKTKGALCMDVCSSKTITIEPNEVVLVPTGFKCAMPEGVGMLLYARSSLPLKKGLIMANSVGVIDSDYRGEVHLQLMNITKEPVEVSMGERLGQIRFVKEINNKNREHYIYEILESDLFDTFAEVFATERGTGGFGSTGQK